MNDIFWTDRLGNFFKFAGIAADGRWQIDEVCSRGIMRHDRLPGIVNEALPGWYEIDPLSSDKPYSEPSISCCHLNCLRAAKWVFIPIISGTEDGRIYTCAKANHIADTGLTSPMRAESCKRWEVEVIE